MQRNYIINNVEMLQASEDTGINPVYIKITENGDEFETVIEVNNKGVSKVTSDWPYLNLSKEPSDEELNNIRTRIVDLMNEAGAYLEAQKKLLLEKENKKGNA